MASPQPPPTPGDDFSQRVLSVPVGPAIGGQGFPLGFRSVAEDQNPAAVLSMSELCGAEIPPQPAEEVAGEAEIVQHLWNKWLNDRSERKVPKLMEEGISATMLFLQSKVLCIKLAATICDSHHQQPRPPLVDPDAPS